MGTIRGDYDALVTGKTIIKSSEKDELNQDITQIVSNNDDPQFLIHPKYLGWISLFSNSVGNCGADIP